MTTSMSLLPFDVRPFRRESLESYSARLLAANFCTDEHRTQMTRALAAGDTAADMRDAWMRVLTTRTKRSSFHLAAQNADKTIPIYGDRRGPVDSLPARYACALCTRGAIVEQNPHFDDIICRRHSRWIGIWGDFNTQHRVSETTVAAQKDFGKLRRKGLIDRRLYLLVVKSLIQDLCPTKPIQIGESIVFAQAIRIITKITADTFARRFFDLSKPYAESFALLQATIDDGEAKTTTSVLRALWLYLYSTVVVLRVRASDKSLQADARPGRYRYQSRQNEYPLRRHAWWELPRFSGPLQPRTDYLALTSDSPESAVRALVALDSIHVPTDSQTVRSFTCEEGHEFEYRLPEFLPESMPSSRFVPKCGLCTNRRVIAGVNDLETTSPKAAAQFDLYRNGGLTPSDVAGASSRPYWFTCSQGHSHEVSPSKKALPTYNCPICSHRTVRPRVNDLATNHPSFAAMWDGWSRGGPAEYTAGSAHLIYFYCEADHQFSARPYELTSGKRRCNICPPKETCPSIPNLATTHPEIAARWHLSRNGSLRAEEVTHGTRREVWWTCDAGHDYKARVDKSTRGQRCPVCTSRKLVKGVNDLATVEPFLSQELHPYLNHKQADEMFPSDHLLIWQCKLFGHRHSQTVQSRRSSKGCPKCESQDRILVLTEEWVATPDK